MPKVLVADTSVLIDVERASLTASLFGLPHEFAVPDILYESELREWTGPELLELGLRIETLTRQEVARATELGRRRSTMSTPDVFAFCLAAARGWILLTGDRALRNEAQRQNIAMHGVLWIFDELHRHGACAMSDLRTGLEALRDHPRCYLPTKEINLRLERY